MLASAEYTTPARPSPSLPSAMFYVEWTPGDERAAFREAEAAFAKVSEAIVMADLEQARVVEVVDLVAALRASLDAATTRLNKAGL